MLASKQTPKANRTFKSVPLRISDLELKCLERLAIIIIRLSGTIRSSCLHSRVGGRHSAAAQFLRCVFEALWILTWAIPCHSQNPKRNSAWDFSLSCQPIHDFGWGPAATSHRSFRSSWMSDLHPLKRGKRLAQDMLYRLPTIALCFIKTRKACRQSEPFALATHAALSSRP